MMIAIMAASHNSLAVVWRRSGLRALTAALTTKPSYCMMIILAELTD